MTSENTSDTNQAKALNKTDVMRWVSVKDELPNVNQYVIIYDGTSVKDFYYFNNLKEFRSFYEEDGIQPKNENVTHWMPLPKPPIA